MTERELDKKAAHRLAVLRHAEEVSPHAREASCADRDAAVVVVYLFARNAQGLGE